jgi:hypothetical protein
MATESDSALPISVGIGSGGILELDFALPISVAIGGLKGLVYRVQRERYADEHGTPVTDPVNHFLEEVLKAKDNRLVAIYSVRTPSTGQYLLGRLESTLYPYVAPPDEVDLVLDVVSGILAEPVIEYTAFDIAEVDVALDLNAGTLLVVVIEHTLFDVDEADIVLDLNAGTLVVVVIEHTMFDIDEADIALDLDAGTLVAIVIEHTLFDIAEVDIALDLQSGSLVTV